MKCPVCNTVDLVMTERSGIEIDYCPQCRGVWLDRGELDKIIERNASQQTGFTSPPKGDLERNLREEDKRYRDDDRRYRDDDDYYKRKKKKNLFDDLFDF
jgi:Zn-finger nucleic acid-binding protein